LLGAAHSLSPVVPHATAIYSPVWDFDVGALLYFRLSVGPSCYGGEAASPTASAKADLAALAKVLFEVGRLAEIGRRLPVICPVALSTVGNDALRSQLVRLLREAPPAVRKLVILEIVAPPATRAIWPATFTPDARTMPVSCALRLGLDSDPRRLALTGIQLVTLELAPEFRADKVGLGALDLFAQCALANRLPLGVMGLHSRALVLAATASGYRQLSGAAVHPGVSGLGQAVRFDLTSVYRDLLPAAATAASRSPL
jgi:hypothetical protein